MKDLKTKPSGLVGQEGLDKLFWRDFCRGKTIVLLHGWGLESQTYQPLIKQLQKSYRVLVPDLPGFGKTPLVSSNWGVVEYAQVVVAMLEKMELERVTLIGHSFGGRLALEIGARWPEKVERLVFTGTPFVRRSRIILSFFMFLAKIGSILVPFSTGKVFLKKVLYRLVEAGGFFASH
ncbi:alpha/beta hydrolase [Patescibacteria group bacterium]|nr:alpha/beta hydrolase [Patescibacteria group bacterium]